MQFFGHRSRSADPIADHDQIGVTHPQTVHPSEADVKAAYDRGRREGRAGRRRSPLLTLAIVFVALVGAGVIALAAREGSFTRGGEVVDQKLAVAADQAVVSSRDAAAAAAQAARDASRSIRSPDDRAG